MALIPGSPLITILGFRPTGDLGPLTIYTAANGTIVAYLKAPPKEPPTYYQQRQRNRFRLCGWLWDQLAQEKRDQWNLAAARTNAAIHGYGLFTYWQMTKDLPPIRTIERQTFTRLVP